MTEKPGTCRWCGCSHFEPCPEGCGWANGKQTLCTACVNVDREWKKLGMTRPPNRLSFFRGFMAGSDDERAVDVGIVMNPYRTGMRHRYWQLGFDAGAKEA